MRIYDEIKTANNHIHEERYDEVVSICPEISTIDSEIVDLSMKVAISRIEANSSNSSFDELNNQLNTLKQRRLDCLTSIGKPADYLDEIYTCPLCRDTGFIDGKKCSCYNKKVIDLIFKDSNLKNITANENFDTFSFDWYNDTDIDPATGLTPYNNMHKVLKLCQDFVENFDSEYSNILFTGRTGVGKTFLANCIAKSLLDSSHSVIYLTAVEFFSIFEDKDFKHTESTIDISHLVECDLLIIDDLGTETTNSYTNSKLFYIINERLLRRKSVVISTNYDIPEFEDCYSQRIFSRIVSAYRIIRLFGEDIRHQKRRYLKL